MDRRVFVRAGSLALLSLGLDPIFLDRAAYATARRTGRKTLVCIFQRGAVDGLNMIVPHGDPFYHRARPRIAVRNALDLDGYFGLHPSMAPLLPFWQAGTLGIVHAAGSPARTRSHFDAQDFMESGTPEDKTTEDGWLNRHLVATQPTDHDREHIDTPFRGVAMGTQLPRILRGTAPALAIGNLQTFGVRGRGAAGDRISQAFESMYAGGASGIVASSSAEGFEAMRMLRAADMGRYGPRAGVEYPRSTFGQSMERIARLIKADLGTEIAFADVGGWDTHVNQGASDGQLAARLRDFASGLAAFVHDLGERMADIVILTMSEFGRTVAENGSIGTDHGRATAMMVLGGGTRGGMHGRWPGLDPANLADGRDLAVTTDFRDLFGEVLVKHLGTTDLQQVFPAFAADSQRWVGAL
ncbi:MAG TPA: DUF1501 domain-containing protein [Gemmatimonadales bacterium]